MCLDRLEYKSIDFLFMIAVSYPISCLYHLEKIMSLTPSTLFSIKGCCVSSVDEDAVELVR